MILVHIPLAVFFAYLLGQHVQSLPEEIKNVTIRQWIVLGALTIATLCWGSAAYLAAIELLKSAGALP